MTLKTKLQKQRKRIDKAYTAWGKLDKKDKSVVALAKRVKVIEHIIGLENGANKDT